MYVTIDDIKEELRLDADITAYNTLITKLIARAEARVQSLIEKPYLEYETTPGVIPEELQGAIIMLAISWFNNPSGTTPVKLHNVPHGVYDLLIPFQGTIITSIKKDDSSGTS